MTIKPVINSEIEEQLQLLAGDIFIQLEDKFNQLAGKITDNAEQEKQQALAAQKQQLEEKFTLDHEQLSQSKHDTVNLKYSEIEQLRNKLLDYETKYTSLKERAIQNEGQLKAKLTEEQSLLEDLRLTKENRELLQSQLEPLNQQTSELNKEKEKLLKDVAKLENKYQQLQKTSVHEIAELKACLSDDQNNQHQLQTKHEELSIAFAKLETLLATEKSENVAAKQQIKTLTTEHNAHTKELNANHKDRLKIYEQASGSSSTALKSLEQSLDESQQRGNTLTTQINQLNTQIKTITAESKALTAENKNILKAQQKEISKLNKEHKTAAAEQQKIADKNQKELNKQQRSANILAEQERQQQIKISASNQQIKQLEKEHIDLNTLLLKSKNEQSNALGEQQAEFEQRLTAAQKEQDNINKTLSANKTRLAQANLSKQTLEQQVIELKSAHQAGLNKIIKGSSVKEKQLINKAVKAEKLTDDVQQRLDKQIQTLSAEQQQVTDLMNKQQSEFDSSTADLQQRLTNTDEQLEQLEKTYKSTWLQNNALTDKVSRKDEKISELQALNSSVSSQLINQREDSDKEQAKVVAELKLQTKTITVKQKNNINDLQLQLNSALQRFDQLQSKTDDIIEKINNDKDTLQNDIVKLQQSTSTEAIALDKTRQQLVLEREKLTDYAQKNAILKSRQNIEDNQIRTTLKSLRDENHELKQRLDDDIADMESKVTEYRLKFEYAQKQIAIS